MKKQFYIFGIIGMAFLFFFGGCYTQLAVRDRVAYEEERFDDYDESYDTSGYYDEYEEEYYEDGETVVNNYYVTGVYPSYRRYFWHYYPTYSVGVHFGSYYYSSFCMDPFSYWSWCYSPWYNPYYTWYPGYWNPGYYYDPYYYGYGYGGGWANTTTYKERGNNLYKIRNNDGLRGSALTRGTLSRRSDSRDEILKTRGGNSDVKRTLTREGTRTGRQNGTDIKRREVQEDVRKTLRGREEEVKSRTGERKNTTRDNKTNRPPQIRKKSPNEGSGNNGTYRGRTDQKKPPKYSPPKRTDTEKKPRSYSPPKRSDTENKPRSYSPPKGSYNPPRSTAPPQRSTPPSGRSGGSQRSGGNERRR